MGELKLVQTSFPAVLWAARKDSEFIHMTFAMLSALYRCRSFPQLRDEP